MIRKLVAAGVLLVSGYVAGVFFGYRAAVVDYVENDAQTIESMADNIYPSPKEGGSVTLSSEQVEQLSDEADESSEGSESRAFQ